MKVYENYVAMVEIGLRLTNTIDGVCQSGRKLAGEIEIHNDKRIEVHHIKLQIKGYAEVRLFLNFSKTGINFNPSNFQTDWSEREFNAYKLNFETVSFYSCENFLNAMILIFGSDNGE